jgi:hypothetical protein
MIEGAQSFTQALDRSSGSSSAQQQDSCDTAAAANDSSGEECDDAFDSLWTGFGETAAAMDCTANTNTNNSNNAAGNDYDCGGDCDNNDDSSDDGGCADVGGGYDYDESAQMDIDQSSAAAGSSSALQVMRSTVSGRLSLQLCLRCVTTSVRSSARLKGVIATTVYT